MANARLTEQIFDGGFLRVFAKNVTAEICPVQAFVMFLFAQNIGLSTFHALLMIRNTRLQSKEDA